MSPSSKGNILIVEDHNDLAELLSEELKEAGLNVKSAPDAEKGLERLKHWPADVVVSDLRLPGMDGLQFLQQVKSLENAPLFLIITAFGTVEQAVAALKQGADDFLTKPLDLVHFEHVVRRLLDLKHLREQVAGLQEGLGEDDFSGMIGRSPQMRALFNRIQRIGEARGPALILGESGTGKELVARALHGFSDRKEGPFLAVNCAGIPEPLMESEFFGHEEGAFTGTAGSREGLFPAASGGTLLLDEIAEMPLALQSKLLRILQDGRVRPVGANKEVEVDVRIIAATHRNLEEAVKEGTFREDLYFRLETFQIEVPPLRAREGDIELLAHRFLTWMNRRMGKNIEGFAPDTLDKLIDYSYPGNVRELQNAVERAVTFCDSKKIRPEHLPSRIRSNKTSPRSAGASSFPGSGEILSLAELEKQYVAHVLELTEGNKKKAAELLGISRKTLYSRLEQSS